MAQNNLQKEKQTLYLGRQGENEVLTVEFDLSAFATELGAGTAVLVHRRATDQRPYIVKTTMSSNILTWIVTDVDTHIYGTGTCEIRWLVGEKVKKSAIFYTSVTAALMDTTSETPGSIVYMINTDGLDERYLQNDDKTVIKSDYSEWATDDDNEFVSAPMYCGNDDTGTYSIELAGTKYVDKETATIKGNITTISDAVTTEATARETADTTLSGAIETYREKIVDYLTQVRDAIKNSEPETAVAILDKAILDFNTLG